MGASEPLDALCPQRTALYGPMPVKTETFRELWAPLVHTHFGGNSYGPIIGPYLFLGKFVWTNAPESSSQVSPYTGIGPWKAILVYFLSSLRARTAKTFICTKSGVSADSRKSTKKGAKPHFLGTFYTYFAQKVQFCARLVLFLESVEAPLFVQINVFAVRALRLDGKYTRLFPVPRQVITLRNLIPTNLKVYC